jgi:hypothetical protein
MKNGDYVIIWELDNETVAKLVDSANYIGFTNNFVCYSPRILYINDGEVRKADNEGAAKGNKFTVDEWIARKRVTTPVYGKLPTIGAICERVTWYGKWIKTTICGVSPDGVGVVSYDDNGGMGWRDADKFRHIPEEVEITVELDDGKAYQFDYNESEGLIGICHTYMRYGSEHVMFVTPHNSSEWNTKFCTNIKLLTVGEK